MQIDRAKIVDYYLQKVTNEDFEIYEVRQELEKNNFDEEDIKIIVRLVDNQLQRHLANKSYNNKSNQLIWIGATLTAVGALITIGTFTGLIDMGQSFLIVYGPFIGGISILLGGIAKRSK